MIYDSQENRLLLIGGKTDNGNAVDVNEGNRKLMALTQGSLRSLNIAIDPTAMTQTAAVGLAWNAFWWMRTEGQWTYLHGGIPTQTVYDSGQGGLQKRGPHDLRGWIDGVILRKGRAERVNWNLNELQVWEVSP